MCSYLHYCLPACLSACLHASTGMYVHACACTVPLWMCYCLYTYDLSLLAVSDAMHILQRMFCVTINCMYPGPPIHVDC